MDKRPVDINDTPTVPADESLAAALADGRNTAKNLWEVYSEKTKRTMLVEGKSLDYWAKHFEVPLFNTTGIAPTPTEAKHHSARVGNLVQEATTVLRNIKLRAASLEESYEKEVDQEITRLLAEWKEAHPAVKRTPGHDLLERQAKQNKAQLRNAVAHAKGVMEFFENIERQLLHVFKALDQIGWANAHEIKADGYIPKV